jgi:hypothetical protein
MLPTLLSATLKRNPTSKSFTASSTIKLDSFARFSSFPDTTYTNLPSSCAFSIKDTILSKECPMAI